MFWRRLPLRDLPQVNFAFASVDKDVPEFPFFNPDDLWAIMDASYGTDLKNRKSVTGLAVMYCNTAIAWKSKLQDTVATSSTEAEFIAAVHTAKIVKYLRSVMKELGLLQSGPTKMLVDNKAAIDMINEKKPTPRSRHIDIQHFAVQEWRERGDLVMQHVPGIVNASDDLTKALAWILHNRHGRRLMGHFRPPFLAAPSTPTLGSNADSILAGEGVGAQPVAHDDEQRRGSLTSEPIPSSSPPRRLSPPSPHN